MRARCAVTARGRRPSLSQAVLYGVQRALLRYLYCVREEQDGEALFLSNRGQRISERGVQHRVRYYAEAEGLKVTAEHLIHRGRTRRAAGDPGSAARALGFARPDAVRRRYRAPAGRPEPVPADDDAPHPFLEPLNGTHLGAMPAPRGTRLPPPTRQDLWFRLEEEIVRRARLPHPAARRWREVTGLADATPAERVNAYAAPVASMVKALEAGGNLPRGVASILADEVRRATYASDAGLLSLHQRLLEVSSDVAVWSRIHACYPAVSAKTRDLRAEASAAAAPSDRGDWPEVALAMLIFGSPERVIGWADQVLSTREGQEVLWTLVGTQWDRLSRIRDCAIAYYRLPEPSAPRSEVDAALVIACIAGLVLCEPTAVERGRVSQAVEEPALMYFMDTVTVVLYQLLRMLGHFTDATPPSAIGDDRLFVRVFEREWDRLLPFTNGFFGFAVVPRVSYDDMMRYQRLRYRPYGRLESIPYEVGDYLVHQAKGSMHFLRPFVADRLQDAFYDCISPLFGPLVFTYQGKIADALLESEDGPDDPGEALDMAGELAMTRFHEAYDRYDFYQHPPGGPAATISGGVIGWRRRQDMRHLADQLGLTGEPPRTPFAAYARGHLRRLMFRAWRDLKLHKRGRVVSGPGKRSYLSVSRLAAKCKCSADVLRRLDIVLQPIRVRDVFRRQQTLGRKDLSPSTRLYPNDAAFVERVRSLLSVRSGVDRRLEEDDECTRTAFARRHRLSVWRLMTLERRGIVKPRREGRFVIYDAYQRRVALAHLRPSPR